MPVRVFAEAQLYCADEFLRGAGTVLVCVPTLNSEPILEVVEGNVTAEEPGQLTPEG